MKNNESYLKLLAELLTENSDSEIINFAEDLIEGVKLRHNVIKEAAIQAKKNKTVVTEGKKGGSTKKAPQKPAPKPVKKGK